MTQENSRMTNWLDYFQNAMQPPKLPPKPSYTQNSPTNDFGYTLGQALGTALFGERIPKNGGENAGINTDLSQAQSDAYVQNRVDPNSALGQAMRQYGYGNTSNTPFSNPNYVNEVANQTYGGSSWDNARAAVQAEDAANNRYNFDIKPKLSDVLKNQYGWGWRR